MNCIRVKSPNNEYHIILTFIKELKVFSKFEDRSKFNQIMIEVKEKMGCKIYAQAIMLNHVHMIIKEGKEKELSSVIISMCTRFAKYYNKIHKRSGKLFSRRYKSIPINDEAYFFRLFRYVLRNPVKAGVLKDPWDYSWSSAKYYLEEEGEFYYPEIKARYEEDFKYHPYTLEEFVSFEGNDQISAYTNLLQYDKHSVCLPVSLEEFISSPMDDNLLLRVNSRRYQNDEAFKIYKLELEKHGIEDLKNIVDLAKKQKEILRLRHIGITLIQLRKMSGMSASEINKAIYLS